MSASLASTPEFHIASLSHSNKNSDSIAAFVRLFSQAYVKKDFLFPSELEEFARFFSKNLTRMKYCILKRLRASELDTRCVSGICS